MPNAPSAERLAEFKFVVRGLLDYQHAALPAGNGFQPLPTGAHLGQGLAASGHLQNDELRARGQRSALSCLDLPAERCQSVAPR